MGGANNGVRNYGFIRGSTPLAAIWPVAMGDKTRMAKVRGNDIFIVLLTMTDSLTFLKSVSGQFFTNVGVD